MKNLKNILKQAAEENNINLSVEHIEKLIQYLDLLQTWNRVYNLTNITTPKDMVYLHIIDSLMINSYLQGTHLLDVGTGAGLPGIPLAIVNPQQNWVLLDKNSKKTRFLTQAIAELNLKNATVIHSKSEDFHTDHCFDSILSRAYGTIRMLAETTAHLLCANGILIAMKGKYPQDEVIDVPDHIQLQDVTRIEISGIQVERHIIRLKKRESCG